MIFKCNGAFNVNELLAPLRLRSGATTSTIAIFFNASASVTIPFACTPSSLETKIRNIFTSLMNFVFYQKREGGNTKRRKGRCGVVCQLRCKSLLIIRLQKYD